MPSLLHDAVHRLNEETGLDSQLDGPVLCIVHQGETHRITLVKRRGLRAAHIGLLKESAPAKPWAVATEHVGRALAKELRASGVQFIDLSGNAHLSGAFGLVLLVGAPASDGHRAPKAPAVSTYKVAFVLLARPALQNATMRELADVAGVGLGTATRAVRLLEERGWLLGEPGRREIDAVQLWRAFEHGYVDRLASKVEVGRFRPLVDLQTWLKQIDARFGPEVLLGGAAGAQRLGLDIHAATAALHVSSWDTDSLRLLRLVPDGTGTVVVRSQFGTVNGTGPLVHPILMRAELLLERDERLDGGRAELARRIELLLQ